MNNITATSLGTFFSSVTLLHFFVKAFSIVFSVLFLVYAVVTYKQTEEISRTVQNARNRFILLVSLLQIIGALGLLAFAITLV